MTEKEKTIKSIVIMVVFTLGGKVLGFFREMLIASRFGSGAETDAFFMALGTIYLFSNIITNSINTTFIPILFEIEEKEGKDRKITYTNNMKTIITLISIALIILGLYLSPHIVNVVAGGFTDKSKELTVELFIIALPIILFASYIGLFTSYLQSEGSFLSTAILAYPMSGVYIIYLLFFSDKYGIYGFMVAAVLSYVSQYLIQYPILKKYNYPTRFYINFRDKYVKKFFNLSIPVIIGVGIIDVNEVLDKVFASRLAEGSVSALSYSNKLVQFILGVFIMAITTVVFPILSREFAKNNVEGVSKAFIKGMRLVILFTLPAMIAMVILSTPIVSIAFERGAFTKESTLMTSQALVFYSIGISSTGVKLLLDKTYYSLKDTKTPMYIALITVITNFILNSILVDSMGHRGLALATSLSVTMVSIIMYMDLSTKKLTVNNRKLLKFIIRVLLSSLIMGLIVFFEYKWLIGRSSQIIAFLLTGFSGLIVYIWFCYIFRVDEIVKIIMLLKNRWRGYES